MSKLTYKDFLQETLSDKPSKLFLSNANGVTDFYLDVLSEKHSKIKRDVIAYGIAEQEVYAEASKIADKVDRVIFVQDSLLPLRKSLADAMVDSGSFDNYREVLNNPVNCDAVIARSYSASEYATKK